MAQTPAAPPPLLRSASAAPSRPASVLRGAALALAALLTACAGFDAPSLEVLNPFAGRAAVAPDDPGVSPSPVGDEIARIRRALVSLRGQLADADKATATITAEADAAEARYRTLRDATNAGLAAGATPGDPALLAKWREAEAALGTVDARIGQLAARQPDAARAVAQVDALAARVTAARALPGAVPEDGPMLDRLAGQIGETRVATDRAQNDLAGEVTRRSARVAEERRALSALSLAIASGRLAAPDLAARVGPVANTPPRPLPARETRRPLVTIGFAQPGTAYRQALYNAVAAAVDRSPGVSFDVVAVAPSAGEPADQARALDAARAEAEGVAQAIVAMGIPAGRVSLGARTEPDAGGREVRVYVR